MGNHAVSQRFNNNLNSILLLRKISINKIIPQFRFYFNIPEEKRYKKDFYKIESNRYFQS